MNHWLARTPLLMAMLIAPVLAACSSSASSPLTTYTATPGTDTEYVSAVCSAQAALQEALGAALQDPSKLASSSAFNRLYQQPFDRYVQALENAHPPPDLLAYHESLVRTLAQLARAMKQTKQISTLVSQASKIPQPPAAAAARLEAIAKTNADCQRSGFSFTGGAG